MALPTRLLASVGRRRGRALLAVVVVLAGAATAVGMGAVSSSSPGVAEGSRPAVPALAGGALGNVSAMDARKPVAQGDERRPRRGTEESYRRNASRQVPEKVGKGFLPLYREAERSFGVNWRLIASIHRQETGFSTAPGTYRGLNAFGCCAGPMQFNVTNGPVSTWDSYREAFRAGRRPERYPHRTDSHPSIYDDFDAIMAAGSLLSDSGAGRSLDAGAWRGAYSYYGRDLFGVKYASEVLARAVAWERDGFCLNCGLDESLVAEFDDAYGASVRRQLLAPERRRREREEREERREERERQEERDRRDRREGGGDGGPDERAPQRSPTRPPRPSTPPSAQEDDPPTRPEPPPPTTTQPSTPEPEPEPAAGECSSPNELLGC